MRSPSERRSVTIYDVATRAGVSIATVSNALNAPSRVRAATRERVLAAVDELGFVRRSEAYARARRLVGRIGVVAPFSTYPSYHSRLLGVLDVLRAEAAELLVYDQASLTTRRDYLATLPLSDRIDGVIVMSLQFDDTVARRLTDRNLPAVLVEFARPGFSSVHVDDAAGGVLAAEHFVANGHERCAFVGEARRAPEMAIAAAQRLDGFRAGLLTAGLDLPEHRVLRGGPSADEARRSAHQLFDLEDRPTAIFTHSDVHAAGVLEAIRERDWQAPRDVAVIGFDDVDFAGYLGLTTIAQPLRESGRVAAELLLAAIADRTTASRRITLPLQLVVRRTA